MTEEMELRVSTLFIVGIWPLSLLVVVSLILVMGRDACLWVLVLDLIIFLLIVVLVLIFHGGGLSHDVVLDDLLIELVTLEGWMLVRLLGLVEGLELVVDPSFRLVDQRF